VAGQITGAALLERGERFLLSRASMVTASELRRLPGLTRLTLDELDALHLPPPADIGPSGTLYWTRRSLLAWWRRYCEALDA
jgi:hypothetical protein